MDRNEARRIINGRPLTDFVALDRPRGAAKDMYTCPVCGAGSGRNGNHTAGLKLFRDTNRVICFPGHCFTQKGEDTVGALRIIWGCDESEVFRRAGITVDGSPEQQPKHQEYKEHQKHEENIDHTEFYKKAHEALLNSPEALEYLHRRGITDDSINRFDLGYCAAWKHSKAGANVPGTRRIIIPRTAGTYTARRIDSPQNERDAQYTKMVQGRQGDIFNLDALEAGETPFIVEGELDAISLLQAGAAAVAGIGTITNAGRILEEAKKHPEKVYILALDNDEPKENGTRPGYEAQKKLAQEMAQAGICCISVDTSVFYGGEKDGNDALVKDREALARNIARMEADAQAQKAQHDEKQREDLYSRTGEGMLDAFFQTVTTRDFEPIPTGIPDIDRALSGGLTRKTLVLLSGAPGLGKTALAQMITENIAKAGRDVLFLNMEMAREQLIARALARIAWTEAGADMSPLEIMRGYSWTDEAREGIGTAAAYYLANIAPRMVYNPDGAGNHIDSLLQAMLAETTRIKAQGRPAPIVCIDYLQLIDTGERDEIAGLKRAIYSLKEFAKANDTILIAISATNRASNRAGTVDMESGRDTSAVEYSGDVMLGLSYTAIEDRRKVTYKYEDEDGNEQESKPEECTLDIIRRIRRWASDHGEPTPSICNEISLKVLKNRFGEPDKRAKLIFDGKHNLYRMAAHGYQEAPEYSGKSWGQITGK